MTEFIATCPCREQNSMNKQGDFQFELPPPPPPPNEDQLRGYIHPLAWDTDSEPMGAGNLPISNRKRTAVPPPRSDAKIDAHSLWRISRGREVGLRAVEFDEVGDLINAEDLYMEALSVLIPASRDLDSGPYSNRSARLREKTRVQREASAMLNRCERLRSLIEANDSLGRSVQEELPKTLTGAPSVGIQQNNNGRTLSMEMSGLPSVGLKVPDNEILFRGPDVGSHNAGRNGNRGHGSEVDVE